MRLIRHVYNVLLVSSAGKLNTALLPFFDAERFEPVTVVDTVSRAQRMLAERDYDLVIINAPLPDDFGRRFAIDVCTDSGRVALLIVRSDIYDETCSAMTPHGVLVIARPINRHLFHHYLQFTDCFRTRMLRVERENEKLKTMVEDMKVLDRAKLLLVTCLNMSEEQAHRYLEKQAMDLRVSRLEVAKQVIQTYQN